jgi:hypothetical protein
MFVPLVQPMENVEDEIVVSDLAAEITEGVNQALHIAAVVVHHEVILDEVVEHGVKVKRTCVTPLVSLY